MDLGVIVSVGALLISFWLAFLKWREHQRDKELAIKAGMEKDFKAPAERDSIIVAGAQEAVAVLRVTLEDKQRENLRCQERLEQVEQRNTENEKRIRHLEKQLAELMYTKGKPDE